MNNSCLIKHVREWRKSQNLPIESDSKKQKITVIDSTLLEMGKRTDGKITGDPRHKADEWY